MRRNPTQADSPGAGHSVGDQPHHNVNFPALLSLIRPWRRTISTLRQGEKGAGFPSDEEGILTPFDT
jgi:hypothetical protein